MRDLAQQFVILATNEPPSPEAAALLAHHPELSMVDFFTALVCGEAELVSRQLAFDPDAANRVEGPCQCFPIQYVAFSSVIANDPARHEAGLETMRAVLRAGADPNAAAAFGGQGCTLPPLYGAAGLHEFPAMARLLLEAGAQTHDGESVYHATQRGYIRSLELLVEFGCDLSRAHEQWGNTPMYFVLGMKPLDKGVEKSRAGVIWLLEHGADPNVPSYEAQELPLHLCASNGHPAELAEALIRHGAEVDRPRRDGVTALRLAVRSGNDAVAAVLRAHGADDSHVSDIDRLIALSLRGRIEEARAIIIDHPDLPTRFTEADQAVLVAAADQGNLAGVKTMLALGWNVAARGFMGATALHAAAWRGVLPVVEELLSSNAPLELPDDEFGATPLGWAAHGSHFAPSDSADHVGVARTLLAAGANPEAPNKWGELPASMASEEVAAILEING